jgi:hypothetical protein
MHWGCYQGGVLGDLFFPLVHVDCLGHLWPNGDPRHWPFGGLVFF